ncbi:MAG: hypothetical protein MUO60_01800 [Clostridiaceae bacterium]|nr:hypothetical protein [Clostridiaceae bacterium]
MTDIYCIIKHDSIAKGIPQYCIVKFPTFAKKAIVGNSHNIIFPAHRVISATSSHHFTQNREKYSIIMKFHGYIDKNVKLSFEEFGKKGATKIMEEIVGKSLTNSYHKRLAYLEGAYIMTLAEYAKKYKVSHSNLINKAKRQTIEAFLEKGVWKIGVNQ